jgi:hypothetical protein
MSISKDLKRILYFDINGTITHIDSTSGDLDPRSELNELVAKNFTPTLDLVNHPSDERYYDLYKNKPEKIYQCCFKDGGDLHQGIEPYYNALESLFNSDTKIFPSFENILKKYSDPFETKIVFRTFGHDGPFILHHLINKTTRNFLSCTYHPSAQILKIYDPLKKNKYPDKIIKGYQEITNMIYVNNGQDYLIKDDYKWWVLWNKDPHKGKTIFSDPTKPDVKIYSFDDLPNAMSQLTHRVNTILAATQNDYFTSFI